MTNFLISCPISFVLSVNSGFSRFLFPNLDSKSKISHNFKVNFKGHVLEVARIWVMSSVRCIRRMRSGVTVSIARPILCSAYDVAQIGDAIQPSNWENEGLSISARQISRGKKGGRTACYAQQKLLSCSCQAARGCKTKNTHCIKHFWLINNNVMVV